MIIQDRFTSDLFNLRKLSPLLWSLRCVLLLLSCFLVLKPVQAEIFDNIHYLVTQERHIEAIKALEIWMRDHSRDEQGLFMLAEQYTYADMLPQAITTFRHVLDLRPSFSEAYMNLAVIYDALGEYKAAIEAMDAYLKEHVDSPKAHNNLARLHVKMALKHYQHAWAQGYDSSAQYKVKKLQQLLKFNQYKPVAVE